MEQIVVNLVCSWDRTLPLLILVPVRRAGTTTALLEATRDETSLWPFPTLREARHYPPYREMRGTTWETALWHPYNNLMVSRYPDCKPTLPPSRSLCSFTCFTTKIDLYVVDTSMFAQRVSSPDREIAHHLPARAAGDHGVLHWPRSPTRTPSCRLHGPGPWVTRP